jgi:hypothetical protein
MLNVSIAGEEGVNAPVAGVTCSHAGTLSSVVTTVKYVEPVVPDRVTVCEGGSDPPCASLKVRFVEGVTVTELWDVRTSVTCIVAVLLRSPCDVI